MSDFIRPSHDSPAFMELSGVLRESVEEILREPILKEDITNAMDRARQIAQSSGLPASSRPLSRTNRNKWPRWFGWTAATASTITLAIVIWWSLLPRVSLADVASAVLEQPWIHVTDTDPNGGKNEFWYSPVKDISAWHDKDWIEYRDHRVQLYYAYDLQDKVLYRVPEEIQRSMEHFASMIESLRVLLQSKQPVDNPLERLRFLGNEQARYELVKQEFKRVKQDDREWLDYYLTVKVHGKKLPKPIESHILFRVDPETKLLRLVRYEYDRKGEHVVDEQGFDYPEKGPADVYDLGVPKTAKLVDRVPANDLARILETIRAGRQRMDDYRAVVVHRKEGSWRTSGRPEIMYHKGDKFRRDSAIWINPSSIFGDPNVKWPEGDKNAGDWWKKCVKEHCFLLPIDINHGSTVFSIKSRQVTDPDGSVHSEITGVEKRESNGKPGERYPALWSWMPEFACRPPLGVPHETLEAVLEPNPKEGPEGTVLLRVRHVGPKRPQSVSPQEKLLPPPPDAYRNWLDPKRDYAVVRWDMIGDDGSGKETVDSTIIDKMAKSPQGTWYTTQIRRKGAITESDGKKVDQIIDIYVDFNADLPDSLFEPPASGRIH